MAIKIFIAEDESVARRRIKRFLSGDADVQVVGEAADGVTAVRLLQEKKPDLLLLDIQMPELNGFEVIERLDYSPVPEIIFTTAYDNYAIAAFEAHAMDYLLKPFERDRFDQALARAKLSIRRRETEEINQGVSSLLESMRRESKLKKPIVVKTKDEIHLVKPGKIDWIETNGDYLRMHVGAQIFLLRETLSSFEAKLDPEKFLRIHRSTIVNIDRIKKLYPLFRGSYVIELEDGTQLTSSRKNRDRLQKSFDNSL